MYWEGLEKVTPNPVPSRDVRSTIMRRMTQCVLIGALEINLCPRGRREREGDRQREREEPSGSKAVVLVASSEDMEPDELVTNLWLQIWYRFFSFTRFVCWPFAG